MERERERERERWQWQWQWRPITGQIERSVMYEITVLEPEDEEALKVVKTWKTHTVDHNLLEAYIETLKPGWAIEIQRTIGE